VVAPRQARLAGVVSSQIELVAKGPYIVCSSHSHVQIPILTFNIALTTPEPSHPTSKTSSIAVEGFPHGLPITQLFQPLGPRQHDPTTANPIRDVNAPVDRKKPEGHALQSHPLAPEIREPSLPKVLSRSIGIKEPKRTLTLLGPKSSQRPEELQGGRKSSNRVSSLFADPC
jgi:hypothetical protein